MSIYKKFRSVNESEFGRISSRYDQPTYMSFKLVFAQNRDINYNDAGKLIQRTLNYDIMPHPLFGEQGSDNVSDRETYSAIDYLIDSNEYTRAEMMKEFIDTFNELQNNFQWYFKSIDGVEDLLKINVESGRRILSDKRLTIHTMEGIDLRMSHLLNLYRKIAWDDTYQRWVLPEMMRYFTLRIYITEFRTFHEARIEDQTSTVTKDDMVLRILDDILPTWIIECEMCEFDIESFKFNYLNSLDVSETPGEATTSFSIKVGKIYETQIFKIFRNAYLVDKSLNGSDRLVSFDGGYKFDSTKEEQNNNEIKNACAIKIGQNTINDSGTEDVHISGLPFNQYANSTDLIGSADTNKNTWISNALTSGVALATNYVNEKIDKLKMTPIPSLGFSVTELGAALESKNIFTALGLVRKAINNVSEGTIEPSEKLSEDLVDSSFKSFLLGIVSSAATSSNLELSSAANTALNDKGVWEALKDFSKSTNLVGPGEQNAESKIENGNIYKDNALLNSQNDRSKATDLDGGNEIKYEPTISVPISIATNSKIVL